jgi:hypothetical protein
MKGTQEQGRKFYEEGVAHLVHAHGCYEGAFRSSNFPGYVDAHTLYEAVRDALIRYALEGQLCVGAKGRACGTCRRILAPARCRFRTTDYYGKPMTVLSSWGDFYGSCCDRDPENGGRPFPRRG